MQRNVVRIFQRKPRCNVGGLLTTFGRNNEASSLLLVHCIRQCLKISSQSSLQGRLYTGGHQVHPPLSENMQEITGIREVGVANTYDYLTK